MLSTADSKRQTMWLLTFTCLDFRQTFNYFCASVDGMPAVRVWSETVMLW